MYEFLRGRAEELTPTYLVLDTGNTGYYINISLYTYSRLKEGQECQLFLHQVIRDDAHLFFGFSEKDERDMFRLLITVSGIGANTARMILSALSPEETRTAIASDNVAVLKGIKGIGAKTAQRLIVDLRDKIGKTAASGEITDFTSNRIKDEALSALVTLGFSRPASSKVLDKLISGGSGDSVEDLIREALKRL